MEIKAIEVIISQPPNGAKSHRTDDVYWQEERKWPFQHRGWDDDLVKTLQMS